VLSLKHESRAEVGAFSSILPSRWMNGVIQSVSSFGIFVRPAGLEAVGKCFVVFLGLCLIDRIWS
jgi:hypothetical protein